MLDTVKDDNIHVYLDLNITNVKDESTELVFNQTRANPVLNHPQHYFLSVVRFTLETANLPVFIPQIDTISGNPNKTIYEFSQYNGATIGSDFVTYVPCNNSLGILDPSYYYVYSYQNWVKMMNTTIASFWVGITPFFEFDVETSLLKLYFPLASHTAGEKLGINNQLRTLLDTFPMSKINGTWYIDTIYTLTNKVTLGVVDFLVINQESTTIPLLNPIQNITFLTSLIPISNSLSQPPVIKGQNSNDYVNSNITPILTDFVVDVSNASTYKTSVVYNPTAEYRLLDLTRCGTPLISIDIRAVWKDKYGNFHRIFLDSGCSANIKLMFRKKIYNGV